MLDAWMEEFHFYLTFDDAALAPLASPDRRPPCSSEPFQTLSKPYHKNPPNQNPCTP